MADSIYGKERAVLIQRSEKEIALRKNGTTTLCTRSMKYPIVQVQPAGEKYYSVVMRSPDGRYYESKVEITASSIIVVSTNQIS